MKVAYLTTAVEPAGSTLKFFDALRLIAPGPVMRPEEAIPYEPEIVVVCGDYRKDYEVAKALGLPYLLIANDSVSMRTPGMGLRREEAMMKGAGAIIYSCPAIAHHFAYIKRPSATVLLRPLASYLDFEPFPKTPDRTLVYAGRLAAWSERETKHGYRCYQRIFRAFSEQGWRVHLYSRSGTDAVRREFPGCIAHGPLPYADLLREMSRYTAGFQGFANEGCPKGAWDYAQIALPNKTWDYLAAGIPTIGYQTGAGGAYYDGRWGCVLDSLDALDFDPEPISPEVRAAEVMDADLPALAAMLRAAADSPVPYRG